MMTNLIESVKDYVTQSKIEAEKRVARFKATVSEQNYGKQPTIDNKGRAHAPCDGYIFDGVDYLGGQFLHTPPEVLEAIEEARGYMPAIDLNKYLLKTKVVASVSDYEIISLLLQGIADVGKGASWDNGMCYLYFKTKRKSLFTLLENIKAEQFERRKQSKGEAPVGKTAIEGVVRKIKTFNTVYGQVTKIMIELDNKATCYGTLPSKLGESKLGDRISFSAAFTNAGDDNTHSFYKRPNKAKLINS